MKDVGPAVDEKQAEADAGSTMTEIYTWISKGKTDNLFSLLSDPLIVFGPRVADATMTRSDALVSLGKEIDDKTKGVLASGSLEVVASPGGHSAWAFDVVSVKGKPVAVLALLRNDDDIWSVSVAALAQTPSMKEIRSELEQAAVVPPGARATAEANPSIKDAVDKFRAGLLDPSVWGADLSSRTEAIVIGPSRGDVTRGKKAIKKLWKRRIEAETRAAVAGKIAGDVMPDGQLAWVTAPVTRVEKDEKPLPLRVFAVFERDGDGWKMIALHEALAVDQPGAGAEFVKILPPAPKTIEEPPPVPDKPVEKKKKKKKKKKKQKKHIEDDES